jgi:hypothetical protein
MLAFSACILQALSGSLPSLVVCCKPDRPPHVEFFSDSCSCRQDVASCRGNDDHAIFCVAEKCIDIHLVSPAALAAPLKWQRPPGASRAALGGTVPTRTASAAFRLGFQGFGMPRAAPPLPSASCAISRLRC